MSVIIIIAIAAAAVALGLFLAYVPMRLLLTHMSKQVSAFIQRQRERRASSRESSDRRKSSA